MYLGLGARSMDIAWKRNAARRLRPVGLVAASAVLAGLFGLSAGVAPAGAANSTSVLGSYSVEYGNQAIVKVSRSSGQYSIVSETPILLGLNGNPTSSCYLPQGTLLATFSGTGPTYPGQHGLWFDSDCSFGQWDPGTFTSSGSTLTFNPTSGSYQIVFTKVTGPPTPTLRSMGLLTWQTVDNTGQTVVESCTATVVDSPNRSTVITAAHCFNRNGPNENIQFAPAHTGDCINSAGAQLQVSQCGSNPYGVWYAGSSNLYISSAYMPGKNHQPGANDFALVVLAPDPSYGPVEDLVGGFPLTFDPNASTSPINDPEYNQTWDVSAYAPRDPNWATEVSSVSANPQNAGSTYYLPFVCLANPTTHLATVTGHWNDQVSGNCDFVDPMSGAETPFQMPPLGSGIPGGSSGAPWTNNQNSSNGAYTIGAVEAGGACTGACTDPNGTYLDLIWSNVLGSHAQQLYSTAGSAPVPYRQAYSCSSGTTQDATVSGRARAISLTGQVQLSQVTFTITNPTSTTATVTAATVHVPDPDPAHTPYVSGSAAVAAASGWTAGHDSSGVYASFSGSLTIGPGQTISTPALSASYTEGGPTGTKVTFEPGAASVTISSPVAASVTCSPTAPIVVFARTHY